MLRTEDNYHPRFQQSHCDVLAARKHDVEANDNHHQHDHDEDWMMAQQQQHQQHQQDRPPRIPRRRHSSSFSTVPLLEEQEEAQEHHHSKNKKKRRVHFGCSRCPQEDEEQQHQPGEDINKNNLVLQVTVHEYDDSAYHHDHPVDPTELWWTKADYRRFQREHTSIVRGRRCSPPPPPPSSRRINKTSSKSNKNECWSPEPRRG